MKSKSPASGATAAQPAAPPRGGRGIGWIAAVAVAVVGFYAWTVAPSRTDWGNIEARGAYYNLLVDGFSAGQLHLKVDVPPGLAALEDPYDPRANHVFRTQHHLHDTSYYQGRIYLYYGPTPALVLFGPYHWLTGGYLYNKQAAFVFAAVGYLAALGLLTLAWRRYFPSVPGWVVAACSLALGLANSVPALLRIPAVCEVAIACGYAFTMLAALGVWLALHDAARRDRWMALASLGYGLAVGARPSVLFGAVMLLAPVATLWWRYRSRGETAGWPGRGTATAGPLWRCAAAAVLPILAVGIGLALYNFARFGSIFEFGQHYQLAGDRQDAAQHFSAGYLWFNFRMYFLQWISWVREFPFIGEWVLGERPAGHGGVESAHGILANTPFALFAAASAIAWWTVRAVEMRAWLAGMMALFGTSAIVLCLFYGTVLRYQAEFHPPLVLLAALGVLTLEAAGGWRLGKAAGRVLWLGALGYSLAFGVLASIKIYAEELNREGVRLAQEGRGEDARQRMEAALRINGALAAAHANLGELLLRSGDAAAAEGHFARALEHAPRSLEALSGRGRALAALGRIPEAVEHFQRAIAVDPAFAPGHLNLGILFAHLQQPGEAARHFEAAIQLGLDSPDIRAAWEQVRRQPEPTTDLRR